MSASAIPPVERFRAPEALRALSGKALLAGAAGAVVAGALGFASPAAFFRGWLVAFLFWFGIAMGLFALSLLHHLTHGNWGIVVRRLFEAASRTIPLLALLFVPVLLGMRHVYSWSDPAVVAGDALLAKKAAYLNVPGFAVRAAICFALWWLFAVLLDRLSRRQDETPIPGLADHVDGAPQEEIPQDAGPGAERGDVVDPIVQKMQRIAAGGLLVFVLASTVVSIDWLMSIDPHYMSSIYGVYFIGSEGLSALAFLVLAGSWLAAREPMSRILAPRHFHDWGKLLLAFVMLWAYFAFSQFLITWSGNIPEETLWYAERLHGVYRWLSLALVLLHFVLPFLLLLSADLKRDRRKLSAVAVGVLAMRVVDLWWQAAPPMAHNDHLAGHHVSGVVQLAALLASLVAIGGIWIGVFARSVGSRPIVPVGDPSLKEALGDE